MDYSKILCYADLNLGERNLETPIPKNYNPDPQLMKINEIKQLNDPYRRKYIYTEYGRFSNITHFLHYKFNENELYNMIEWAKNTFPFLSEFTHGYNADWLIHFQVSWPKTGENTGWQTPHVDIGRAGELLYLLDLGGDNVRTTWYHDPMNPIYYYEEMKNIQDMRGFKEITGTILKPKTWYYFRTNIIHEAKYLTSNRIALVITFGKHKSTLNNKFYEYLHDIHKNFELNLQ